MTTFLGTRESERGAESSSATIATLGGTHMERPDSTNDDGRHDRDDSDESPVETIDDDTAREISDDDDLPA